MVASRCRLALAFALLLAGCGHELLAQGFYYRTVQKNPLTGRQEIVDLQRPRWTGERKGGVMFEPAIGAMQVAAVGRSRLTGRLEYYNHYMNPWTGAQHATATQFNPYSGRYETLHQMTPPPAPKPEVATNARIEGEVPAVKPKPRVRVIEMNLDADAPLPAVSPGAMAPVRIPGGVVPPQEQASSKTIEWKKEHPETTLDFKVESKDEL